MNKKELKKIENIVLIKFDKEQALGFYEIPDDEQIFDLLIEKTEPILLYEKLYYFSCYDPVFHFVSKHIGLRYQNKKCYYYLRLITTKKIEKWSEIKTENIKLESFENSDEDIKFNW